MAASEEMSSLFPIFILSVMGLFVVPWTIFRITTAATRKGKNLHCRCSECMRSPKYQTTLLKKVSLTLPSISHFIIKGQNIKFHLAAHWISTSRRSRKLFKLSHQAKCWRLKP